MEGFHSTVQRTHSCTHYPITLVQCRDAKAIFRAGVDRAGVDAVSPLRLAQRALERDGDVLKFKQTGEGPEPPPPFLSLLVCSPRYVAQCNFETRVTEVCLPILSAMPMRAFGGS